MPTRNWRTVPLKGYPRGHRDYLPIDPHTGKPLDVGDEPIGCTTHGIDGCGTCSGTVEPWEPPKPTEGKTLKRPEAGAGIVTGPARPAVTFRPFGSGCTRTIVEPKHEHALGPWRARKGTVAPPAPEPTVETDPLAEARAANRALAERLGITLPD